MEKNSNQNTDIENGRLFVNQTKQTTRFSKIFCGKNRFFLFLIRAIKIPITLVETKSFRGMNEPKFNRNKMCKYEFQWKLNGTQFLMCEIKNDGKMGSENTCIEKEYWDAKTKIKWTTQTLAFLWFFYMKHFRLFFL